MSSTPAGWYPDPSAPEPTGTRLRWWDGARWTDHVHVPEPPVTAAPGGSEPAGAPAGLDPYRSLSEYPRQSSYPQQHPAPAQQQYPPRGVKAIATPDGQALAGLGLRLLARIIDIALTTLVAVVAGWSSLQTMTSLYTEAMAAATRGETSAVFSLARDPAFTQASQNWTFVLLAVSAAYTILSIRFYGATPGKVICRIRVRAWDRPGLPTWGQSIVRWTGSDLLGQLLFVWYFLDFLWPCWDQRKQALHDKLARTVVVRR